MNVNKKKRKKDRLLLEILIIVVLVLVVFEGRLIWTMFQQRGAVRQASGTVSDSAAAGTSSGTVTESGSDDASAQAQQEGDGTSKDKSAAADPETEGDSGSDHLETDFETETESETSAQNQQSQAGTSQQSADPFPVVDSSSYETTLAGLSAVSAAVSSQETQTQAAATRQATVSNPESPAIVREQSVSVDDSYFADAAFIGDSRMEGFHLSSGITQGQFFTSVGMSLSSMSSEKIIKTGSDSEEITVAAALSGGSYSKVYIMLGTNDLGEFNWDSFKEGFVSVLDNFSDIQPDAIFYICSVIYVEESKVYDTDYINNENVDKINSILLEVCEEEGYYYLDLNELLSDGAGSLYAGASSDGVHLYASYCKEMLNYLKSHYVE